MSEQIHNQFLLTQAEKQSFLWKKILAQFEYELQVERQRNDSPALGEADTAKIRGRISKLKEWINRNTQEDAEE